MLNCQHHIQWVTEVSGGLHQCILCTQVVTKKDVIPRMEDLPADFERRWEAWEAKRLQPQAPAVRELREPAREPVAREVAREPEPPRPEPRLPAGARPPLPPAQPSQHG